MGYTTNFEWIRFKNSNSTVLLDKLTKTDVNPKLESQFKGLVMYLHFQISKNKKKIEHCLSY